MPNIPEHTALSLDILTQFDVFFSRPISQIPTFSKYHVGIMGADIFDLDTCVARRTERRKFLCFCGRDCHAMSSDLVYQSGSRASKQGQFCRKMLFLKVFALERVLRQGTICKKCILLMPRIEQMVSHRMAQQQIKKFINYSAMCHTSTKFKTLACFHHYPQNLEPFLYKMPVLQQQKRFRKRAGIPEKDEPDDDEVHKL